MPVRWIRERQQHLPRVFPGLMGNRLSGSRRREILSQDRIDERAFPDAGFSHDDNTDLSHLFTYEEMASFTALWRTASWNCPEGSALMARIETEEGPDRPSRIFNRRQKGWETKPAGSRTSSPY